MKKLIIEWKHFDKDGATCKRCSQTGRNLNEVINQLKEAYLLKGIEIQFKETRLPENRMAESNQILINGMLLENLIPGASSGKNFCSSCSDLIASPSGCSCRTINQGKNIHEEIPVDLIKSAINQYVAIP